MKVADVIKPDIEAAEADMTIRDAATLMIENEVRALPVCRDGILEGIVTDRDLLVRVIIGGADPEAAIATVMSSKVYACQLGDEFEDVQREMGRRQIRRVPVVDGERRLLGMISLTEPAEASPAATASGAA